MGSNMQVEVQNFSVRQTAAAMRKALREKWAGVKFSVRMDRGSGHGWISVTWTDGPTDAAVSEILAGFQDSRFDGQDDGYHRIRPTRYAREDGTYYEPRYSCCGVLTTRYYSDDAMEWADRTARPGTRWWREDDAPYMYEPAYYASRWLLAGIDLTGGFPDFPQSAWKDRW